MGKSDAIKKYPPVLQTELLEEITPADLNDLCDAAEAAIEQGGGFGWVDLPAREAMEAYWNGVVAMPARRLLVARMDGVIAGSCQLVKRPANNQAQAHIAKLTTHFMAPWARGYGLAGQLLEKAEEVTLQERCSVINLDVRETMQAAITLYEKHGFQRIGVHPFYAMIDHQPVTGYYYMKNLAFAGAAE